MLGSKFTQNSSEPTQEDRPITGRTRCDRLVDRSGWFACPQPTAKRLGLRNKDGRQSVDCYAILCRLD
ncbi:MAG: hypothetical protein ACO3EZ_10400 [Prochlorotrichaceae cyanobacterium]